jgi:hypothetical protein
MQVGGRTDRQTDRHDEAYRRVIKFCVRGYTWARHWLGRCQCDDVKKLAEDRQTDRRTDMQRLKHVAFSLCCKKVKNHKIWNRVKIYGIH